MNICLVSACYKHVLQLVASLSSKAPKSEDKEPPSKPARMLKSGIERKRSIGKEESVMAYTCHFGFYGALT